MTLFSRLFSEIYEHIRGDIFKFCRMMNFEPTWQQEQLLGAVQRGDRQICVRSGQGPGKTTTTCIVAGFQLLQAVNAQVIVTAPTMRQCRDVWLAEFRRLMGKADGMLQRLFEVTQSRVNVGGSPIWGVKTVTASQEENAQGFHEKNQTIIGEEASGISRANLQQFKGTSSNPNSLLLLIGNPNTRDCDFFDCFNAQRRYWTCLHWNAEETPASEFFDPSRNWRLEQEFGRDSDVYRIRVLGEFPKSDPNCVLRHEDIIKWVDPLWKPKAAQVRIRGVLHRQFGLDFARFGGDENTIYRRMGNAIMQWDRFPHTEPSDAVKTAFEWQRRASWTDAETQYVADAGGMGQGVMHLFYENGKRLLEFHNNGTAIESNKYDNLMTEAIFKFREKTMGSEPVYIPNDPILINQLTTRQYYMTKKGKFQIESKEDYMARGHESPDRADGILEAFYDGAVAKVNMASANKSYKAVGKDVLKIRD